MKYPQISRELGVFCGFIKNKIEGNKIGVCSLFRSTDGHYKMILQKKKWKKVENSNFGGLFKFEIWIFFQFSNIFFAHFRFFRWKCDSYGIHVIMLFLELLITKKMPEKNWKNIENWQLYTKITKSYICWKKFEHFESNSKYSLYIACSKRNFTLMSKLGLFLVCDKNSGFWSEICDIFVQYIGKIGIGLKYITYFTPESRVFVAHRK